MAGETPEALDPAPLGRLGEVERAHLDLPLPLLALLAATVPVLFAVLVTIPARLLARRPVTPLLTYE